ncbi:MAG: 4-hydroxythreonine-4-phosphate dehydrogenase PdxA [SAR324 cluster bacterium]|uniref:4-hydroxythreonine-4-phosphate dehydrogenase PdxA n=1 Tax=SAR324 cluster bacterium TaxID=2024889 RepID=A0A2A4T575_9DELT|nr:MAG: 4-hydroxythreonine-4-phosphate dehydrogenase PdxA [SAR324 cluster bacterium]
MKPILAITMGDPAGVGPEIVAKALSESKQIEDFIPIVIGDKTVLEETLRALKLSTPILAFNQIEELEYQEGSISVLDFQRLDRRGFAKGIVHQGSGDFSYQAVVLAVELCRQKKVQAMVTAPICKEAWHRAGHCFDGHTGLIASLTQTTNYRMLLASEKLKTLHVTAHIPLREACDTLSQELVYQSILLGNQHLQRLGIPKPRIAVCGLNPHAGENGIFGTEDLEKILPAIQQAQQENIEVFGPLPADTVFLKAFQGNFDMVIAQYHDQGHIPGKLIAFDTGVNVTLGLPIIRTSVDHGTAFDIAGKGIADHGNLHCAIQYALKMIQFN